MLLPASEEMLFVPSSGSFRAVERADWTGEMLLGVPGAENGIAENEPAGTRTQDHLLKREMLYSAYDSLQFVPVYPAPRGSSCLLREEGSCSSSQRVVALICLALQA